MKKLLFIPLLLLTIKAIACDCEEPDIIERYMQADFVASVQIVKNYPNEGEEGLYRSDIRIRKLFKGESIPSLHVAGRYDNDSLGVVSTCDIFIPENTELVVYAYLNQKGQYTIGMCSGLLYLKENGDQRQIAYQEKELKILKTLKDLRLGDAANIDYWRYDLYSADLDNSLDQLRDMALEKVFGLYAMNFNRDLTLDSVEVLSGFNRTLDTKLVGILKNSNWSKQLSNEEIHPEERKQLIGIYYYEAERGNPSFLSIYYL